METAIRRKSMKFPAVARVNTQPAEIAKSPSPSNDPWFADPRNMESLQKGIAEMKEGRTKAYSVGEISEMLGL